MVEKVGPNNPNGIQVGDRVVAEPLISCGVCEACTEGHWHVCRSLKLLGIHTDGGFAEYVKVDTNKVVKISDVLTDTIAALAEPFAVGFHINERGGTRNGDSVFIVGGGPIGLVAGIVAQICGAAQVVFSELNPARVELIKSLGFTVINPANEDVTARVNELTNGEGFDVVLEVSGSQGGVLLATDVCKIRGTIVVAGFPGQPPKTDLLKVIFKELSIVGSRVYTLNNFRKTVKMLENIVREGRFDLDKLISDIFDIADLEKGLQMMATGQNLSKILIKQ